MINTDNTFTLKQPINYTNLEIMFNWFKQHSFDYRFNYVNNTICKLWNLYHPPLKNKKHILQAPVANKTYPDLIERYIHIDAYDPCSYKREVRKILMAGTPTYEIDFSAEAVYIFAKHITHDDLLLDTYINKEIYEIIPGKSKDEQKKLMQIWLQGPYDESIIYNNMFPATAAYLKSTSDDYKRNSGLFRDIETRNLIEILKLCKTRVTTHLHDAIYVNAKGLKTAQDAIRKVYGNDIKYKINNMQQEEYSGERIHNELNAIDWNQSAKENDNNPYKSRTTYEHNCIVERYKDCCSITRNKNTLNPYVYISKYDKDRFCISDDCIDDINTPEVNTAICTYMICNNILRPR